MDLHATRDYTSLLRKANLYRMRVHEAEIQHAEYKREGAQTSRIERAERNISNERKYLDKALANLQAYREDSKK